MPSIKREYPILEFDGYSEALIDASRFVKKIDAGQHCVICFFREAIEKKLRLGLLRQVSAFRCETLEIPVYETGVDGQRLCLTQGMVGAAGAAAQLEELIAMGFSKFVVCGGAGVLQKGIAVGHLLVPTAAVRDEGTSYHYLEPSREVDCDTAAAERIAAFLSGQGIPHLMAKTWTTDSFYRETKDKKELRISEGCLCVEMEAAALFAVSRFREVRLGQIIYGGDDLSGITWDKISWVSRTEIRENLLDLSMRACLEL